jgi:hypothetical protein
MFCKVNYCRFPGKHTTSGHQCGKCKKFGHGQTECMDSYKINELKKYHNDKLPDNLQCTNNNCDHRHNHTSDSHICSKCSKRHFEDNCIIQDFSDYLNIYPMINFSNMNIDEFKNNYNNYFMILNAGMGCSLYLKNDNGHLISLFMHSDSWGQYGPETDDRPIKDQFISGFNQVNSSLFTIDMNTINNSNINNSNVKYFNCPLCRAEDERDNVLQVKGSETKCKVCLDEMATLYFPKCNHICICNNCFKQI